MRHQIDTQGFAVTPRPILDLKTIEYLKLRYESLFRGDFETGIYPDEWHWRAGLSLPNVTREICNGYKSDRRVASVVLNRELAALAAESRGWSSTRIGQDDVIWKPPAASNAHAPPRPQTTVGFHRDADYISKQFEPYENNMVTLWMALDDADEETGCIEYVPGSHKFVQPMRDSIEQETSSNLSFFSGEETKEDSSHRDSLSSEIYSQQDIVRATCPAGHAIFHHQDVWHGSGPNRSTSRHRRALVAHLLDGNVKWIQGKGASYIYGRYRRSCTDEVDEDFFPVLYGSPDSGLSRTPWLQTYLAQESESSW